MSERYIWVGVLTLSILLAFNTFFNDKPNLDSWKQNKKNRSVLYGMATLESKELWGFINQRTLKSDIFIFSKPRTLVFTSNRFCFSSRSETEIMDGRANYLIVNKINNYDGISFDKLNLLVPKYGLPVVFENRIYIILKLKP